MGRRSGAGASVLAAMLWAGSGPVQAQGILRLINNSEHDTATVEAQSILTRDIEIIVWPSASLNSSGAVVAMETVFAVRGGGATFEIGPGTWIITTECHGGGACAAHALTGLSLNGRPVNLPGPTRELELRLGDAGGVRRLWIPVIPRPTESPRPTRRVVISDGVSGDERDAMLGTVRRVPRADPAGDNARGDDGGGGAGGGGAGSP